MRKYALASPEHKRDVDLRDYEDVIVFGGYYSDGEDAIVMMRWF